MGVSAIIDVFISLAFMYLVLSLLCTTLTEFVASGLKLRARDLSKAVTQLIDNEDVRAAFYNNGLISSSKIASRAGKMPNVDPKKAPLDPAKGAEVKEKGRPRDTEHPSYLDGRTFAMALLASVDHQTLEPPFEVSEIRKLVDGLPDSNIRDVLQANIATAGQDLTRLRDNVGEWFDSAMERLSGNFKRTMKMVSLAAGFLIAGFLNADSIGVAKAVWNDPVLRAQITNQAAIETANPLLSKAPSCENTTAPGAVPAETDQTKSPPVAEMECRAKALQNQNQALRAFPLGWTNETFPIVALWPVAGFLFFKLIGIGATALALSLGAPFWFDLLQKIMNIRGTGPKPVRVKK